MSRFSPTVALVLAVLLAGCDRGAPPSDQASGAAAGATGAVQTAGVIDRSQAGEPMPALALVDPQGTKFDSSSLKGKPVLLNLWATWCAPCIKEMPLLDRLAGDEPQLKVLTASQDMGGGDKVAAFFAKARFSHLQPWIDPEGELGFAFGGGLPVSVLYDADGAEVWRVNGDLDWSDPQVRAAVDEALS